MGKQVLAVALCRVSSLEQLENDSLKHQRNNVLKAAELLGAIIPDDDYIWEGQASSKVGVNFNRKDLLQIYDFCKKRSSVKYLFVQEVDRFMRSPDEQTYWYVRFWYELKVRVWFADKPELNEDTHVASLLRYMEGWRAAGSNEERKNKSINGQTAALKDGRWPFVPKPGYMKGRERGIPEIHPVRGSILQDILVRIVTRRATPTQALKDFNDSEFMKGHSSYKMDKFRKIVTDAFYAGIVEIDKQVKFRNENGEHEPLITKDQHYELIRIMNGNPKNQSGPRKNGNPKYVANNITNCDDCLDKRNGRFVGFDHTNGKSSKVYTRYKCRSCGRYLTRDEMHEGIEQQFKNNPVTKEGREDFLEALAVVWKQRKAQAEQESNRIRHKIKALSEAIERQVDEMSDPSNTSFKERIKQSIRKKEEEIAELEERLENLQSKSDDDWRKFLRFAFDFVEHMGAAFLVTSQENRVRCKQIVFPAGFYVNKNNKVYTPEISPLITLLPKKKSTEVLNNSHLVRVTRL